MTAASFLLGSPFGVILTFLGGGQGRRFTDILLKSKNVCKIFNVCEPEALRRAH